MYSHTLFIVYPQILSSEVVVSGRFLVVLILPGSCVLITLLFLSRSVTDGHISRCLFHSAVRKNLLSAHVLKLKSFQASLFLRSILEQLLFADLLGALVHDRVLLSLVKSLKVVGLHAVSSQHRLLRGRVLCHEIVRQGEALFIRCVILQVLVLLGVTVTFFLRHLLVSLLCGLKHGGTVCVVLNLSCVEQSIVC